MLISQKRNRGLRSSSLGAGPVGQSYSTHLRGTSEYTAAGACPGAAHDFCHAKCWGGQQHVTPSTTCLGACSRREEQGTQGANYRENQLSPGREGRLASISQADAGDGSSPVPRPQRPPPSRQESLPCRENPPDRAAKGSRRPPRRQEWS